jgi:predicted small lipoprotein YifL
MLSSHSAAGRLLIAASLLAFALTACGRRGPLEPPPDPAAVAAQKQRDERRQRQSGARADQLAPEGATAVETKIPPAVETSRVEGEPPAPEDDDNELPSMMPSIAPKPSTGRKRGFVIPKEPFILDPLL